MLIRSLLLAALSWAVLTPSQAQMLYKCNDGAGRIGYSDKPCDAPAPARAPARTPANEAVKAASSSPSMPLTASDVEAALRSALRMVDAGDAQGPCALASPSLRFSIVNRGVTPTHQRSGGRAELCAAHQESAALLAREQLQSRTSIASKVDIRLHPDGRSAGASYVTETRFSQKGAAAMTLRCKREETLRLYGDRLLFDSANATCDAT